MGHSERTLVQALGEHSHWLLYSSNDLWNFPIKLFGEISLHFIILFKVWFSLNFILIYSVDRIVLYVQQQQQQQEKMRSDDTHLLHWHFSEENRNACSYFPLYLFYLQVQRGKQPVSILESCRVLPLQQA